MAFTFDQVTSLLEKGFTPEQITALNNPEPIQNTPIEPTPAQTPVEPTPAQTPAEYYKKEEDAPQQIPFGGGVLQETFNALLTQMQETTKALTDATKANQESNAKYLEQPGGSAGDTIESITASIIDPSYHMNKGGK